MKRDNNLWSDITRFDNLLLAWRRARKGKSKRRDVAEFALNLEYELLDIQEALQDQTYVPGKYRQFTLYERKPRLISAAPFRDRVVHHALMNIAEPLLDRRFIFDCYACRKDKGVHRAVNRYQVWAQRYPYVMKLDIASYFPSIDIGILKHQLKKCFKDPDVLWLFYLILDHSPKQVAHTPQWFPGDDLLTPLEHPTGLPIGNLTSQVLANLYLNPLDHFVKEVLGIKPWLRYVDDLFLLSDSKPQLHAWKREIDAQLEKLRLHIHPRKANIFKTREGVDVLGYRVFPHYKLLRDDNGHRFQRKLRKFAKDYAKHKQQWEDFDPSVQSWIGHAGQADTAGLRSAIFSAVLFRREWGSTVVAPCAAVPGTTNRGTCARPTATGTTQPTGTTTPGSV